MTEDKLFCKGGGCTAKLGPGILERVLGRLPKVKPDPNLLVGFDSKDDAAVYQVDEHRAIVQTLDFFPSMVEDPYLFGQIAAANALSDIYAMGGEVKTALNIVCFPENMDLNLLGAILKGGQEKVTEAGGILAGGHSINDDTVKYGLSVMGMVDPARMLQNNTCQEEDVLLLTKPLGTGLVMSAQRVGEACNEAVEEAVKSMTTLNKYAAKIMKKYPVHACTDVTGFGLLGHLHEMLDQNYSAILYADQIPVISHAKEYAENFLFTAAAQRNRNHIGEKADYSEISFGMQEVLFDPQTSGGLLISIGKKEGEKLLLELEKLSLPCGIIGKVINKQETEIWIKESMSHD